MDNAQLKKGIIDIVALSSLIRGDSYGYKIISDVSSVISVSESTLYPILRRLELQGCLTTYSLEYNGRLRKYYSITEVGRSKVYAFTTEWSSLLNAYNFIKGNLGI